MSEIGIPPDLKSLIGHGVELRFYLELEGRLRHVRGILLELGKDYIKIAAYSETGEREVHRLSVSCAIASIIDYGPMKDHLIIEDKAKTKLESALTTLSQMHPDNASPASIMMERDRAIKELSEAEKLL